MTTPLEIAAQILDQLSSDEESINVVSLLDLYTLPEQSGVYMAVDEDASVLYVGKANNLRQRCDMSSHKKLPLTLKRGAKELLYFYVDRAICFEVEQKLIDELKPELNETCSKWWDKPKQKSGTGSQRLQPTVPNHVVDRLKLLSDIKGTSLSHEVSLALENYVRSTQFIDYLKHEIELSNLVP